MAEHKGQFRLHSMCRVLRVQRSGYYAWTKKPKSTRTLADESLLLKIKQSFEESQSIYGSPRVHCDLREDGVLCGEKRIARLMRQAQLRSVRGYNLNSQASLSAAILYMGIGFEQSAHFSLIAVVRPTRCIAFNIRSYASVQTTPIAIQAVQHATSTNFRTNG